MTTLRVWCCAALSVAILAAGTGKALAAPIVGNLNIFGSAGVTGSTVDILPVGGVSGAFTVDPFTQTGDFTALAGTTGLMLDLNNGPQPVGAPFLLPGFMTFAANPDLRFDLTFLNPGVFGAAQLALPPASGQSATPVGSMYNLTNTPNGSTLSFDMVGTVTRISTGETSPFGGVFTMQFSNVPYQSLLATWDAGGTANSTYSASFGVGPNNGATPEPASLSLLLGAGTLLLLRRRR